MRPFEHTVVPGVGVAPRPLMVVGPTVRTGVTFAGSNCNTAKSKPSPLSE
ncbi:Uncharacterised protein [Mycobacteroides abscessus subsp. abscessus]|nr:Uncharacterised protein [Mycobacteroides abscessus subsp. abscessus]